MAIQYLPLDWSSYHAKSLKLAATLLAHEPTVNEIVAISRGGLSFGHILSDFLRIPIWTISIQSYTDIQNQGEIKITGRLQTTLEGKHILLVDDVSDSGKTLVRAMEYVKEASPKKITTMTMFYKPHSVFRPDYFSEQTTKWILFPTEITESILHFINKLEKEGKTKKEIQDFLENLHYTADQIAFVRRHHVKKNKKGA